MRLACLTDSGSIRVGMATDVKREREKYEFDHSVNVAGSAGLDESASTEC